MPPTNYVTRDDLTSRELEVLFGLAEGETTTETAKRLFIADSTVKFHKTTIQRKLGARNAIHAIMIARQKGIVPCICDSYEKLQRVKGIIDGPQG